jgi:hypothetical protein
MLGCLFFTRWALTLTFNDGESITSLDMAGFAFTVKFGKRYFVLKNKWTCLSKSGNPTTYGRIRMYQSNLKAVPYCLIVCADCWINIWKLFQFAWVQFKLKLYCLKLRHEPHNRILENQEIHISILTSLFSAGKLDPNWIQLILFV